MANAAYEEKKRLKKEQREQRLKEKNGGKVNWFTKILKEEHKFETYLLGFISCFAIGVGALMLSGALEFKDSAGWLAQYQTTIGWFFEIVGVFGFLLFIIPIFKPVKTELKQLTLPTANSFLTNIARVFTFMIILALILVLYESVFTAILGKIMGN